MGDQVFHTTLQPAEFFTYELAFPLRDTNGNLIPGLVAAADVTINLYKNGSSALATGAIVAASVGAGGRTFSEIGGPGTIGAYRLRLIRADITTPGWLMLHVISATLAVDNVIFSEVFPLQALGRM